MTDLKTARFEQSGTRLTLIFAKKWNYDRVNLANIKTFIAESLSRTFGGEWHIEAKLDEKSGTALVDEVF